MATHIIRIENDKLTGKQKSGLEDLEFRAIGDRRVVWIYKAMDLQDLVSTIENLQEADDLQGVAFKIKTQK